MIEKTKSSDDDSLWKELEFHGREWMTSWHISCPAVPLHVLRPYWNSAISRGQKPFDKIRMDTMERENNVLKQEVNSLRRQLAELMDMHLQSQSQSNKSNENNVFQNKLKSRQK